MTVGEMLKEVLELSKKPPKFSKYSMHFYKFHYSTREGIPWLISL